MIRSGGFAINGCNVLMPVRTIFLLQCSSIPKSSLAVFTISSLGKFYSSLNLQIPINSRGLECISDLVYNRLVEILYQSNIMRELRGGKVLLPEDILNSLKIFCENKKKEKMFPERDSNSHFSNLTK